MGSLLSQRSRETSSIRPTDIKLVLLGNMGVGKTSLANMFIHGMFQETTISSVGGHLMTKALQTPKVVLHICDTAAMEKFRMKLPDLATGTDAAILVYDLGNRESFLSVRDFWIDYVNSCASENIVKVLVANKSDTTCRAVQDDEGRDLAERHGMLFIETSAKNKINVDKVFIDAATAALETMNNPQDRECPRLRLFEYKKDKRRYCVIAD